MPLACETAQSSEPQYKEALDLFDLDVSQVGGETSIDNILSLTEQTDALPTYIAQLLNDEQHNKLLACDDEGKPLEFGSYTKDDSIAYQATFGGMKESGKGVYVAEVGDYLLHIPACIAASNPDTKKGYSAQGGQMFWGNSFLGKKNKWTRSHNLFRLLVLRALRNKQAELERKGETVLRFCCVCGRSSCPFGGPYVYIRVMM